MDNKQYILELSPDVQQQIEKLKQKTEDRDLALLVQKALGLYDALTDELIAGGKVYIHLPNGTQKEAKLF